MIIKFNGNDWYDFIANLDNISFFLHILSTSSYDTSFTNLDFLNEWIHFLLGILRFGIASKYGSRF